MTNKVCVVLFGDEEQYSGYRDFKQDLLRHAIGGMMIERNSFLKIFSLNWKIKLTTHINKVVKISEK